MTGFWNDRIGNGEMRVCGLAWGILVHDYEFGFGI